MEQADYDGPWKDVLDLLFDSFMALFFPFAHEQIDSVDPKFRRSGLDHRFGHLGLQVQWH